MNIVSNSKWNLVGFSFTLLAHFLSVPIVVKNIGLNEFGHAGLVLALWAPLLLFGAVLSQFLTREIAHRLSNGEVISAQKVSQACIYVYIHVCLWIGGFFVVTGPSCFLWLNDSLQTKNRLQYEFLVVGISWVAQQGVMILQASSVARQNFKTVAKVSVLTALATLIFNIVATTLLPNSLGYLISIALSFIVTFVIWLVTLRPWLSGRSLYPCWQRDEVFLLLHFGKWQGMAQLAGSIAIQIDRYVLGAVAPANIIGQYNVAMRLQEAVHMGVLKIGEVLFPRFSATCNDPEELRISFFITTSWIFNSFAASALTPLIPLSKSLLTLWVGPSVAVGAAPILCILAASGVLGSASNVYSYFALGTGQSTRLSHIMLMHSTLVILFTVILIKLYGPVAAGLGYLISNAFRLLQIIGYSRKSFNSTLSLGSLIMCTLTPAFAGLLTAGLWISSDILSPTKWAMIFVDYVIISATVVFAIAIIASMSSTGRAVLETVYINARGIWCKGN